MKNWQLFETIIQISARNIVALEKIPSGAKWIGPGKTVPVKSPVDFMGTVAIDGRGTAIVFDAKQCENKTRFPVGHKDHFPPHQRRAIIKHGEAGAIAGLLIESTHLGRYFWLPWRAIRDCKEASIAWDDPRMIRAGSGGSVSFGVIVADCEVAA